MVDYVDVAEFEKLKNKFEDLKNKHNELLEVLNKCNLKIEADFNSFEIYDSNESFSEDSLENNQDNETVFS